MNVAGIALAAFPYGRIQVANFLVAGTLLTLFAVAQHRGVRPMPRGVLGPAFQFVIWFTWLVLMALRLRRLV